MTAQQNDRPVKEFRSRSLKVAIWENQSEQDGQIVTQYSMTYQKRYRDRQTGEWRDSGTLFPDNALVLAQLLEQAYRWVEVRESEPADAAA